MNDLQKVSRDARLHHKTVSNYEKHTVRHRTMGRKARERMSVMKVDPRVWEVALNAANGDRSRIQIISETAVRVVNQSKRRA